MQLFGLKYSIFIIHFFIILPEFKTIGLVKKELNLTNQYEQNNKTKIFS